MKREKKLEWSPQLEPDLSLASHPLIYKAEIRARWEVTEWQAIKGSTFSAFASGIAEVAYHKLIMSVDLSVWKSSHSKTQIKTMFWTLYYLDPRMDKAHHTVFSFNQHISHMYQPAVCSRPTQHWALQHLIGLQTLIFISICRAWFIYLFNLAGDSGLLVDGVLCKHLRCSPTVSESSNNSLAAKKQRPSPFYYPSFLHSCLHTSLFHLHHLHSHMLVIALKVTSQMSTWGRK